MLGKVYVQSGHAVGFFLPGHLDGVFESICHALHIVRVDEQGSVQGFGSPANSLQINTPRCSTCDATNSFATRFMPSCNEVTMAKSAMR
jgi:hypothetical protein